MNKRSPSYRIISNQYARGTWGDFTTYSDRNGGLVVQVLELVHVTGKQRLLDEQWSVGLEGGSELLGHTLVDTTVEVTKFLGQRGVKLLCEPLVLTDRRRYR